MKELYELRVYPEPSDAYEDDGKFHLIWKNVTLDQAHKLIHAYLKVYDLMYAPEDVENEVGNMYTRELTDDSIAESLAIGEAVAVSHTDGNHRYGMCLTGRFIEGKWRKYGGGEE